MELVCDRLHDLRVELAWLPKHSQRVATERAIGEQDDEPVSVTSHRFDQAVTRRRGPPRDGAPAEGRGNPVAWRGFRRRVARLGSIISVSLLTCVPPTTARRS